ncbi:MAG: sialidase family protein [Bryobacter sp.]|nr:sialidase family protein [Bryobacter sp.]
MRACLLSFLFLSLSFAQAPPGVVIDYEPASARRYIGSPSIEILPNGAAKGSYVASHDFFGPASNQNRSSTTRTFRSDDGGLTWRRTAEFQDQFWSNLFFHRGALYLMGTTYEYGRIVIRKSVDGGLSWLAPSYLTQDTGYHTAPVNMIRSKGKLWRSFEFHPEGKWGNFEAFALFAPEKADLMDPKSWTRLPRLPFPRGQSEGDHWLEGNLVEDRRGRLLNLLRVDNLERAAIVVIDEGSGQLRFERTMEFPGGAKKFQIRWDKKSKQYWAMANPAPPGAEKPASLRNRLVLMSSPDLATWTIVKTVLEHPDPANHAFQYVDWRFAGKDIIVASRTAFDDAAGGAHRAHDANYLTFHRTSNFRQLKMNK